MSKQHPESCTINAYCSYTSLARLQPPGSLCVGAPPGELGLPSFQAFARELGLLHDDAETAEMLAEGVRTIPSSDKIYALFEETLVWLDVNDPPVCGIIFCDCWQIIAKPHRSQKYTAQSMEYSHGTTHHWQT